jgi:PAS domain S-box-containing protein/putative nucleotidyltransferase with HDIG domain
MQKGADSPEYSAIDKTLRPYLTDLQGKLGYYELYLFDLNSNMNFSLKREDDFSTNFKTGPFKDTELAKVVNKAINSLITSISEFKYYRHSDAGAAFIASPVMKNDNVIGVLALQISTEELFGVAQDYIGLGKTGETVLAVKEGDEAIFVAPLRHDLDAAFNRRVTIGSKDALPIQEAVQGQNGFGLSVDYRGKEILAVWRYLPALRWGMVVKIDTEEAFAPVVSLKNWAMLIGIATALSVLLMALYASRSISRPIRELQKGAETIGEGALDYKMGTDAPDEIGYLSRSFDNTVAILKNEIYERRSVEKKLRDQAEVLSAINEIFRERINCKTEEDLGKKCLKVAEKLTNSKFGFFGELNSKGYFDCIAISNPGWDACSIPEGQSRLIIKDMPLTGIDRATMIDGVPRIINGEEAFAEHPDHVGIPEGHPALTAFLGVPFIENGKVIGMIGLGNKEGGYTLEDQKNIEALSVAISETLRTKRTSDEKRRAQELIIQSKQDWESTFNQITDMITIHDKDYNIVRANKAAMETLKLPYVKSDPVKCYKFYHGTESNPKNCPSCTCMQDHKPVSFETFEPYLNMFMEVRAIPRFDKNNKFSGIIHIVRDITDRKKAEEALLKSEKSLSEAQHMAHVGNWDWDITNNELKWSDEIYRIFGLVPQQFNATYEAFMNAVHPDDREIVSDAVNDALNANKPYDIDHRIILPDGKERVVHEQAKIVVDKESKPVYMIGTVQDITERKHAEDKTKRHLENLNALRSIDIAITSSLDLTVTLNVFLEHVIAQLHADAADVMLLNQHTMTLDHVAEKGFKTDSIKDSSLELGEGYAGYVALERKTVIEKDISNISDKCSRLFLLKDEHFKTYFGIPLISKGSVKGVLEVYNRSSFEPDEEWLKFFEALAGQAAIAIDNSAMFDEVQHSRDELVMAYDSTIEGWARALDHRDKETEGHSRRVTNMTVEIARKMGFSDPELVHIRRGALLHDIGKLGVPDSILLKPGKLTDDEWEIMKSHTIIAHEILTPIPYLRAALHIPYSHHEKWDGSGYPQGLKGEAIPIEARIFAIVDIWDALNSDRPYRKAWPREKIIEYIKSLSGNHLDPNVVDVFEKIYLVKTLELDPT